MTMKRFGVYFVLGLVFGVLDWYYLDGLAYFPWGSFGNSIFVVKEPGKESRRAIEAPMQVIERDWSYSTSGLSS